MLIESHVSSIQDMLSNFSLTIPTHTEGHFIQVKITVNFSYQNFQRAHVKGISARETTQTVSFVTLLRMLWESQINF